MLGFRTLNPKSKTDALLERRAAFQGRPQVQPEKMDEAAELRNIKPADALQT